MLLWVFGFSVVSLAFALLALRAWRGETVTGAAPAERRPWRGRLILTGISLLSLAVSSLLKWRVVASGALLGLFFVPSAFGAIVNEIFLTRIGHLVGLWASMSNIWLGLFGIFERQTGAIRGRVTTPVYDNQYMDIALLEPPLWASWLVIALVCAVCVWLLARKVRAYEVIK